LVYRGAGHGGVRSWRHALLLPGLVIALVWATVSEARRRRPDVVHAHWLLPGGLIAAMLPRRLVPKTVLTLHGTDVELAAGRLRPLARRIVRRADVVLAVSVPLAHRAEDALGLARGSGVVARLPLPPDAIPAPLPSHPPKRLLAAGRASREKGLDVLLDALARPVAEEWEASLVTEGPERAALERQARALGLADRVTFCDLQPREKLVALMRSHCAVVVPSRTEGLGMVALEALALGRPVVASAVGGLLEVVADGADGILVPPDDPAALADALSQLRLVPPHAAAAERHRPAAVVAAHAVAYGAREVVAG
jgi:glycosyltransferase involved in cell wall biosynthesis